MTVAQTKSKLEDENKTYIFVSMFSTFRNRKYIFITVL